jgi:hypothetical protein
MRDHTAATALRHSLAASARKDPQRRSRDEMALKVEGVVDRSMDAWMLRKRWADRADLNRCILRSRRRTG